jgi:hypothetical protein
LKYKLQTKKLQLSENMQRENGCHVFMQQMSPYHSFPSKSKLNFLGNIPKLFVGQKTRIFRSNAHLVAQSKNFGS